MFLKKVCPIIKLGLILEQRPTLVPSSFQYIVVIKALTGQEAENNETEVCSVRRVCTNITKLEWIALSHRG